MYVYRYLPDYAQFILQHHLDAYVQEQIRLAYELDVPLLKHLSGKFSEEQLIAFGTATSKDFLSYLAANKAHEQIAAATKKWMQDQLEVIGKFQISAQDITLINYMRGYTLKKLIAAYTSELQKALDLTFEIDRFILGAVTTATDAYITILKNKIEEESNLSNKVIEASPAITFIYSLPENKTLFISRKVQEVMGYEPEQLMGMGTNMLAQLVHPEDLPMVKTQFRALETDDKEAMHHLEYRLKHADGTYRWLRTYEVIFKRDEHGHPTELLGKTFEITAEKEMALALKKREQQLLEAQSIAHIGSYEWNIKEKTSVNTAEVFKLFELEQNQPFESFMQYVHPSDQAKVQQDLALAFKTGEYESEYRYIKNGKEKVLWSLGKVLFENKEPVKMLGTVQDITEIKRMELELLDKTAALERTNESLQQFASIASHDLKEPLRKISLFIEMVTSTESNTLSATAATYLKKAMEASKRMQQMIEDILAFSSLSATSDKQRVNLQTIIDETLDLLESVIKEKNGTVTTDGLPDACVSAPQFKQLFQNLISNSLKFSKQDIPPHITITHRITNGADIAEPNLKPANQYLCICVSDNGIGFEEEYAEKIFDLFNRLHSNTRYAGTGLGLTICKRIAANHEGIIKASSQLDKGATFEIVIPHDVC